MSDSELMYWRIGRRPVRVFHVSSDDDMPQVSRRAKRWVRFGFAVDVYFAPGTYSGTFEVPRRTRVIGAGGGTGWRT